MATPAERVHRAPALPTRPTATPFLKQHAPKVRGLATFGPMPVDGKLMDALPKLEIISNFGVGVDAINLDDARSAASSSPTRPTC